MAYIYNPKRNDNSIKIKTNQDNQVNPIDKTLVKIFNPTIQLDELSITKTQQKSKTQQTEDDLSVSFPMIKINDYLFSENEIDFFQIITTDVVPTCLLRIHLINDNFFFMLHL